MDIKEMRGGNKLISLTSLVLGKPLSSGLPSLLEKKSISFCLTHEISIES